MMHNIHDLIIKGQAAPSIFSIINDEVDLLRVANTIWRQKFLSMADQNEAIWEFRDADIAAIHTVALKVPIRIETAISDHPATIIKEARADDRIKISIAMIVRSYCEKYRNIKARFVKYGIL